MIIFLVAAGLSVVVLALLVAGLLAWWNFDNRPSYQPQMTPTELQAVKQYVAEQDALRAKEEAEPGPEPEPEPDIETAIRRRTEALLATREARHKETAAIRADFPAWLVNFAANYEVHSYDGVADFAGYVVAVLEYALDEFDGRMPIRKCAEAAAEGLIGPLPSLSCSTRYFFEKLSKLLGAHGLLTGERFTGSRGRVINREASQKFASSVQRPALGSSRDPLGWGSEPQNRQSQLA